MMLSPQNPKVKLARSLKGKKERDKSSLFLIEGSKQVGEALNSGASIEFLLYSKKTEKEVLNIAKNIKAGLYEIDEKTLNSISDTQTPQGIIGVVNKMSFNFEDMLKVKGSLILICDAVQDPGNLGTMIRSAAAAGASGVIISDDSVDVYNPKVVRSTGGIIFKIPIITEADVKSVIMLLKEEGIKVVGTSGDSINNIYNMKFNDKTAIVVGNEGDGIKKKILDLCDERVMIPMKSGVESLNAAVAASIVMFEIARQRM